MVGGGGRPQIIRFLGHSSVTLSRLNKLCWAPWLVCIYFFLFSFAAIYTHTDVYTHCHLLLGCVSPGPLVCVCVDGGASCTVIWEKEKKKNISEAAEKDARYTHTPLSSITNFLYLFIFFIFLLFEKKKTALLVYGSLPRRGECTCTQKEQRVIVTLVFRVCLCRQTEHDTRTNPSQNISKLHTHKGVCALQECSAELIVRVPV